MDCRPGLCGSATCWPAETIYWTDISVRTGTFPAAHLADTLVVKLAQLLAYISLVVPVMSSH